MIERTILQVQENEPPSFPRKHILRLADPEAIAAATQLLDDTTRTIMPHPEFVSLRSDMRQEVYMYSSVIPHSQQTLYRLGYHNHIQTGELVYEAHEPYNGRHQVHTVRLAWHIESFSGGKKAADVYGKATTTGPMGDNENYVKSLKQFKYMRSFVMNKIPPVFERET